MIPEPARAQVRDLEEACIRLDPRLRQDLGHGGIGQRRVGPPGELILPLLLTIGLLGRYAALGLSAVNVLAVVSYAHVLLSDGFEAALGQHYLWGLMLLTLLVFGTGRLSLDGVIAKRAGALP